MISKMFCCRKCNSTNIVKNGCNRNGNQRYKCKDCNVIRVLELKPIYTEERKQEILKAYHERPSMRGIRRIYGISLTTLVTWLKKGEVS
jgi:transposase-like protein